ncbi:MAG: hypothetical protein JXA33_11885 [Anaerolineae bacterium]|nr:hypothetical protein [Anaerolineae bacterium]
MFIPYTIVNPLTTIQIPRRLTLPGDVLARVGDSVEPMHIVAEAIEPPDFRIIDLARALDVPLKKLKPYIKVKRGDIVTEGDVLASRGGLVGITCRATISGTVVGSGRGRILLEAPSHPIQLSALVPGIVVETWPAKGVLIETVGAFIQALWGNNKEAYGVLRVAVRAPRHPIRPKHIDASAHGAILVGGSRIDEETLEQAVEMQVRGIIVGGVPASMIPLVQKVDFPVIATEGVGSFPMSKASFDLLRSLDGREAAVCGRLRPRWGAERPYIVVPMPTGTADAVNPETPLQIGSQVRTLRAPYYGWSGTVTDIPRGMIPLETGIRLPGVQVDFGKNEVGTVPIINLEHLL